MSIRALGFSFAAGLLAATSTLAQGIGTPSPNEKFVGQATAARFAPVGCNDTVYSQVPGHPNLFLSRQLKGCDPKGQWQIVLDRFDWQSKKMTLERPVITTPVQIQNATLMSAYDPYVTAYNGKYWIAFECVGKNLVGAATCLAAMDPNSLTVDPASIYTVINGRRDGPGTQYSASDPKLLATGGNLYLYWTAISMVNHNWFAIATRGAQLVPGAGGQLWVKGSGGRPIESHDPNLSVEVWAHGDMFSIIQQGGFFYATAGRAEGDCVKPLVGSPGCYQVIVARSTVPLGPDIFNQSQAPQGKLPAMGQEYARFVHDPNGQLGLMAHFFPPQSDWAKERPLPTGAGEAIMPIDVAALFAN